jgi:FtsP/CotA-like multicopper oxidase with cupredoxin domain
MCELWAMPGTNQVLGVSLPIWGFSSTGAAGTATAPGPVLVVSSGDSVTIRLHNGLAEPMSLALPGQRAVDFGAGLPAQAATTGIAPGDTTDYTFTASRPGTYLYEAGHTSGGARQVAMGLAGALVVLDSGAPGTAYGKAYADEAVLVLSEIDPALNATPDTFDMRDFRPAFRLINGKPYPSTDPVPTAEDHTVLLRYLNAGSQGHAMSLLGSDQTIVAQDADPLAHAESAVVAALDPGTTIDSLVTMPSGPESKVTVYEAAGHLDNDGQTTADPLSVAFGGMLTFLDTAAPIPSTDAVGPVSSRITVSPSPSNGMSNVTVTAQVSDAKTGGNFVDQAELVVDDAFTTGVGNGTPMTTTSGTFGANVTVQVTGTILMTADCGVSPPPVALNCLEAGKHIIYVRGHDIAGNWGVIGSAVLNLPKTGPATTAGSVTPNPANGTTAVTLTATGDDSAAGGTITDAEYFIGAVGDDGLGRPMLLNRSATVVTATDDIDAATVRGFAEGRTSLFVHSKDSLGLWGPPLEVTLAVDLTAPTVQAASVGPNPTNGQVSDPSHPGYLVISAIIEDVVDGASQSDVIDAEAFLDPTSSTLSGGSGLQLLPEDGKLDSPSERVYGLLPLTQVRTLSNGTHHVVVRGEDAAGNWGSLSATGATIELVVDKTAPVLGAVVASPNPTAGSETVTLTAPVNETGLKAAEFWIGTTDPGVGKGTRVTVGVVGGSAIATIPLLGIPTGQQRFNLRVQDLAGNWSNAVNTTVQVDRFNRIFADDFGSGTLAAWSAVTNAARLTVSTTAGIPNNGTNPGLQVSLPGGTANTVGYVTDDTPVGETIYHGRFAFDANSLTSGTNAGTVLTLFEGRTNNAQVFALQFHRVAGTAEVRVVMSRSQGQPLVGAWVPLSTGAHTLQVDWTSGPATGTGAGSLRLVVDGSAVPTLTGNTSTLRVESVRLGVTAGVTSTSSSTMAGRAFFDSFFSTRFTMP